MDSYYISTKLIKNVCFGLCDFQTSLKKETKDCSRNEQIEIAHISGLFFRNYFLINHLANILNFKKNSDEFIFLGLLYVNNAFIKKVDKNKMFNDFLQMIIKKQYTLSREEIYYIKEVINTKRTFDFFDVKKGTLEYYVLRFNKPAWLIKLLTRQYTSKEGFKILYEISSMPEQYCSISYLKTFNENQNFKKVDEGLFRYLNDTSVRKEEEVHNKTLYLTQVGYYQAMKEVKNVENGNVTCFLGEYNSIAYDFLNKFADKNNSLNYVAPSFERVFKVFDRLKDYNLSYLHLNEGEESTLIAILKDQQDFILYSPRSSNIELFRKNPEYGVYFQVDEMDKIINSIRNGLNEIFNYLKVDGELLFILPTINLKETKLVIEEFMKKHQEEAEVIKEKMYLPFKEENSLLYYALIRKIK